MARKRPMTTGELEKEYNRLRLKVRRLEPLGGRAYALAVKQFGRVAAQLETRMQEG